MTTTTITTPLTDAELTELDATLLRRYDDASRIVNGHRAAAEIRALRATRDDLLAALQDLEAAVGKTPYHLTRSLFNAYDNASAAIARAQGRAEG